MVIIGILQPKVVVLQSEALDMLERYNICVRGLQHSLLWQYATGP